MVALPPPQMLSALCDDISSQTMKSLLKNRDSKDFVSLIHPKNLPAPGDYRKTDVDLGKCFLTAATSECPEGTDISSCIFTDISFGLLIALFHHYKAKPTNAAIAAQIIQNNEQ